MTLGVLQLGKYGGAFSGCLLTGKDKRVRNYLGLALTPQAGVAIGLAAMGARARSAAARERRLKRSFSRRAFCMSSSAPRARSSRSIFRIRIPTNSRTSRPSRSRTRPAVRKAKLSGSSSGSTPSKASCPRTARSIMKTKKRFRTPPKSTMPRSTGRCRLKGENDDLCHA